jgi:hypothetical protein
MENVHYAQYIRISEQLYFRNCKLKGTVSRAGFWFDNINYIDILVGLNKLRAWFLTNVKLLAASALLVQSGALLVFFIDIFLQLSNVKPTQVCSARAGRQVISTALAAPQGELVTSILPLKRPTDYYRTKVYRPSLLLNYRQLTI